MLNIEAENGALMATEAAAIQSQNAMADDCRDRLAAMKADLDEIFYGRPSECDLRAADLIWVSVQFRARRDGVRVDRQRYQRGLVHDSGALRRTRRARHPAASSHGRTALPHG